MAGGWPELEPSGSVNALLGVRSEVGAERLLAVMITCDAASTRRRRGYRMRRYLFTALMLACVLMLAIARPAAASGGGATSGGFRINVTGGLVVGPGETVSGPAVSIDGPAVVAGEVKNDVFVGRGNLTVTGHVTGDVLVLDGNATITGRVDGDITVVSGRATIRAGANVHGDVASSKQPIAAANTVHGLVKTLNLSTIFTGFLVTLLALLWVAVTISSAILGLFFVALFPRASEATVAAGRRFGVSLLTGLLVGVLAPIVGVGAIVTVLGIPLGLAVIGTVMVLAPLGYVATAVIVGRLMIRGPRTGARLGGFFAGFGILRFAALVPGLGFVVGLLAAVYGIGALTVAGWRAAHGAPAGSTPASVPPMDAARAPATATMPSPTAREAQADQLPVAAVVPAPRGGTTKATGRRKTAVGTKARATPRASRRAPTKKPAGKKRPVRATKAPPSRRAPAKRSAVKKPAVKKKAVKATKAAPSRRAPAKRSAVKKPAVKKKAVKARKA